MKVTSAELKTVLSSAIYIEVSNGFRSVKLALEKNDISYEDVKNRNFEPKVFSLSRNCCRATPIVIMEKGSDDEELNELLDTVLPMVDEDLKRYFNK